ncbi:ABC transporter permease [Burkholderia multivorans]|uniref:ABC transporter permease n=1 Tax=Burkholderia multivorans TaxID=87883 RepID=UPI000CFF3C0C|nr:ABC transporter permease [Burkholderia multivorans]MBR8044626.1 ABC transporter permease [Burkholderia multivorans]MBU9161544.1 ABC transporter permease [Burkholderia multivorans]MBU9487834.1 ABC transporter permease [Burkholderia multivorans]MBU9619550.1 ABC transporter permease [Burkholderia multivorans]MDR8874439.1 Trehalose transport system permease protein SugB [Burkholderia multivorans]
MATDNHAAPAWPPKQEPQDARPADTPKPRALRGGLTGRAWRALVWAVMAFFLLNVLLLIATVAVNSVATRWFGTPLPQGFTLHWYAKAWEDFQLASVLWVTVEVVGAVVLLSIALGVPAAYALARVQFRGKRFALLVFLLPLMVPPVTYGIPMATAMYKIGLAGTLSGVILANLVPALPFVILVMTPFIEQIDPNLEAAARIFGANTWRYFRYVLLPLLVPGMLAAGLLVLVRTIGMFELTFFTAGPSTQTLVVALYYAVFSTGVRAPQSIDAMAMIYMAITLVWVVIALQFVSPTQLVSRVKQERQ